MHVSLDQPEEDVLRYFLLSFNMTFSEDRVT